MKTVVIVVAGGKGKRMGRPKQFIKIAGRSVLEWTLTAFQRTKSIDEIILVVARESIPSAKKFKFSKLSKIIASGQERSDSVMNGLAELPEDADFVAIHDGARPLITMNIIEEAIRAAKQCGAAIVAVPAKDTLKVVSRKSLVVNRTLDRKQVWQAQTPQVFKKELILKAYKKGYNNNITDDAMLVEALGCPVKLVMGSYDNLKITTPEDLNIAAAIMKKRGR